MMNNFIRSNKLKTVIITLLLAMLLPLVVSCKNEQPPDETPTLPPTDSSAPEDTILEELDFGGEEINILIRESEQSRREWESEDITDSLSQEIYYRNLAVEEALGVTLNYIPQAEGDDSCTAFNEVLTNSALSDMDTYDIVSHYALFATTTALLEYYKDFNSEELQYLDLDKPWWNQNFRQAATGFGKTYVMVGDVNLSVFDRTIVTYFNKALCVDHGIDPDQLYRDTLAGNWTYDMLYNYVKEIHQDLDSNDAKSQGDYFGLTSIHGSEAVDGFLMSFDCQLTVTGDDGTHSLVTASGLERLDSAMSKVMTLWEAQGAFGAANTMDNCLVFTESRALFNIDIIYHYASTNAMMRNMNDEYGMLPLPKFDSEQKEYKSAVQNSHNVMAIIDHSRQNYDAVSAFLELVCKESYEVIRPYYFEKMVKTKYLKDSESGQIFDMLLESTTWDWGSVYSRATGSPTIKLWRWCKIFNTTVPVAFETDGGAIAEAYKSFDRWLQMQE